MYNKTDTDTERYYYITHGKNKVVYKISRRNEVLSMRDRYEVVNNFVKKMAQDGRLNNILQADELDLAKKEGLLPKRYNVHHYIPLAMGGQHHESNLCVIDRRLHSWLHAYILEPIYRDLKLDSSEKEMFLLLPPKRDLYTTAQITSFFSKEDYLKIKEDEEKGTVPFYRPPQVPHNNYAATMRYAEQLKRDMDIFDEESRAKYEEVLSQIETRIRIENTTWRRKGVQISAYWNERREGKTRMPLTRKEKGELKAKKERRVKKASPNRWYPHLVARRFSRNGRE